MTPYSKELAIRRYMNFKVSDTPKGDYVGWNGLANFILKERDEVFQTSMHAIHEK